MKKKKILMIGILIIFLSIICVVVVKINNKSNEMVEGKEKISAEEKKADIIEITDNYFIEQTNDVFINLDDYIDKTIKMSGLIYSYEDYSSGNICYAVVRNTPGCCGNDGLAGLDIRYDGDYPKEDAWVEIEGIVKADTVNGSRIPAIQITSIKETEKGTTFVQN